MSPPPPPAPRPLHEYRIATTSCGDPSLYRDTSSHTNWAWTREGGRDGERERAGIQRKKGTKGRERERGCGGVGVGEAVQRVVTLIVVDEEAVQRIEDR
jgi:hypothetical protein